MLATGITQYTRDADGWRYRAHTDRSDNVTCDAFDLDIPLRDLYALVMRDSSRDT